MRSDGRPFISDLGIDTPDEPVVDWAKGGSLLASLEEPYLLAIEGETDSARQLKQLVTEVERLADQAAFEEKKPAIYKALCRLEKSDHAETKKAVEWMLYHMCGACRPHKKILDGLTLAAAKPRMTRDYEWYFLIEKEAQERAQLLSGTFAWMEALRKELLSLKRHAESVSLSTVDEDEQKAMQMLLDPEFGLIVELAQARTSLLNDLTALCKRKDPEGNMRQTFLNDVGQRMQQFARTYRAIMGERGAGEYRADTSIALYTRDTRRYRRGRQLKTYAKRFSGSTNYALKAVGQTIFNLLQMATGVGLLVGVGRVAAGYSFGVNGSEVFPKYNKTGKKLRPLCKRSHQAMKVIAEKAARASEEKSGERQEVNHASPVQVR